MNPQFRHWIGQGIQLLLLFSVTMIALVLAFDIFIVPLLNAIFLSTKNWCGIIYQCSTGKLPSLSQFLLSAAPWQNSINEHTWPNIKKGVMAGAIMAFIWTLYLVPRRR